jgi:hypothetical protein
VAMQGRDSVKWIRRQKLQSIFLNGGLLPAI